MNSSQPDKEKRPLKAVITARKYGLGEARDIQVLKDAGFEVENYSSCEFGAGASEEELYEKVKDADVIIAGLEPYRESLLRRCEKLDFPTWNRI